MLYLYFVTKAFCSSELRRHDMVLIAEYLWGDDWPVAKRESNEAD